MAATEQQLSIALRHQFPQHSNTSNKTFTLAVDIKIPTEGITAIVGPSGCGKTTLLRCIAGLEMAQGQIHFNNDIWQNEVQFLPCHQRPLAYVFQEASLFAHLNVQKNLLYAQNRADKNGPKQNYSHLIKLLGIEHLLARDTKQLSGGERQRVAIARALLIQPRILLMDEPLASLDNHRKQEILPYLLTLKNELAIPIIYVSHDIDEVAKLANTMIVMDEGSVKAAGPLKETLTQIQQPFVLGHENSSIVDAKITAIDAQWQLCKVKFGDTTLWLPDQGGQIDQPVRLQIFAKDVSVTLQSHSHSSISNIIPVEVLAIEDSNQTPTVLVQLKISNDVILARLTRRSIHQLQLIRGSKVWAQIKSAALIR